MTRWLLRRLLWTIPVLFGVSVVVFATLALIPGDPALAILGPYADAERIAALRAELGLDRSLPARYLAWLGRLLEGDLGRSYHLNRPVLDEIAERLGPTLLLAGAAFVLSTAAGLAAGAFAAVRQYGWSDRLITAAVLVGISTPAFWLALMLILVFSVWLGWLPVSGMREPYGDGGALDVARHLVLPAIALAAVPTGIIARMTRTQTLEVLRRDFVQALRARGVPEATLIRRHVLKNALVPVVPVIGLQVGFLLGGAVYVETVFQWPGLGRMLVDAIAARDVLLVQGGVLVVALGYVGVNLLADLVQHLMDPRIRR